MYNGTTKVPTSYIRNLQQSNPLPKPSKLKVATQNSAYLIITATNKISHMTI